MLNMIKMDLYRMFRTKSLYVIWVIMAVFLIYTTSLATYDSEMVQQGQIEAENEMTTETVNLGISVILPTESGEEVTVYDVMYANTQAKVLALFLVIFTVIFSTADINSGYIKNIGGQVKNRGDFIFSRSIALVIFTFLTLIGSTVIQAFGNFITLGYLEWGNIKHFLLYIGTQIILHCALVCIVMAISVILRNNVWSIVIAVCMCMNVLVIIYSGIDKIIEKIGIEDFHLFEYTVTGRITMLPMKPTSEACMKALVVAVIFMLASTLFGKFIFQKRDI